VATILIFVVSKGARFYRTALRTAPPGAVHAARRAALRAISALAPALWLVWGCCAPTLAQSAQRTIDELKQLNVEDLMNVEVTSVSRHPEKLSQAPSAIQVITQDDIRQRSGPMDARLVG
jgi:hypothetical protein